MSRSEKYYVAVQEKYFKGKKYTFSKQFDGNNLTAIIR